MANTILYKTPGKNRGNKGSTYNFKGCDEANVQDLLDKGWFKTLEEAELPKVIKAKKKIEAVEEAKEVTIELKEDNIDDVKELLSKKTIQEAAKIIGITWQKLAAFKKKHEIT